MVAWPPVVEDVGLAAVELVVSPLVEEAGASQVALVEETGVGLEA